MRTLPTLSQPIKLDDHWFSTFIYVNGIGWAKHHSSYQGFSKLQVGVNAMLQMINKQVHTLDLPVGKYLATYKPCIANITSNFLVTASNI